MAHRWSATGANPVSATALSVTSDAAADPSDEIVLVVVSGVTAAPATVTCTSAGATVEEVLPLTTDSNVWGAAWALTGVDPVTLITVTVNTGKNMTVAASAYEGIGIGAVSAIFLRTDTSNLSTLPAFTADEVASTIVDLWVHRDTATNGTPAGSTMLFVDEGVVTAQLDGSALSTGATGHAGVSDRGVLGVTAVGDVAGTYFDDAHVVSRTSTNALGRSVEVLAAVVPAIAEFDGVHVWVGEFAGENVHEASFDGTHEWAGTFDAESFREGSFDGTHQWAGDFEAESAHIAEFDGAHEWAGTFIVEGSAVFTGAHQWAGDFEAESVHTAEFDGAHQWTGDFDAESSHETSFDGIHEWDGEFSAAAPATAGFEGAHQWAGTFVAESTPVLIGVCGWQVPTPDCCDRWETATTAQRERAVMLATDFLWAASARRFGACEVTVRPCGLSCPCEATGGCVGGSNALNTARFGFVPVLDNGVWSNCKSCSECRCCAPCEVALPGHVDSIVSVRVDGITVPSTAYRVDNYKYLVRDDGQCFPSCQDFGKRDGEGTFEVTYLEGVPVPFAGLEAASELACYLLKTCPDGVNCGSCLTDGAEQSAIVATWLNSVNPNKLTRPAKVFVPGAPSSSFRTETWRAE